MAATGKYSGAQLESYRTVIAGWKQPWASDIGHYLPSALIGSIARHLLNIRWFSREVVLKKWFLHDDERLRLDSSHSP